MYHFTPANRVESILKHGLLLGKSPSLSTSGWPDAICLTPDPNFGAVCASVNAEKKIGVFWVDIFGLIIESCDPYYRQFMPVTHITVRANIPPERLHFLGYWNEEEIERRRLICEGNRQKESGHAYVPAQNCRSDQGRMTTSPPGETD